MSKPTKYNEYREKAKRWDHLMRFLNNENSYVDTVYSKDGKSLRMSKPGSGADRPGETRAKIVAVLDFI